MPTSDVQIVIVSSQQVAVAVPVEETLAIVVAEQGPAGPAGPPGANGAGTLAPLAVPSNRSIADTDAGRVLQCAHGIALTLPAGLSAALALQLMMNATQVQAGGVLTITPGSGVTINGFVESSWRVEKTSGSTSPWMAWLQHETGTDAYSLIALGATLTEIPATTGVYEAGVYEDGVYA